MADLEWWLSVGVDDLGGILQMGLLSGINKLLQDNVGATIDISEFCDRLAPGVA